MELAASPPPQPAKPETEAPAAMGRTIGRGAVWMVMASLGGKGLAFIAQIVLGIWLTSADYAVYGVALAISGFVAVFKDGGVREVLVQRGKGEYNNLIGPVFWLATWMNIFAGLTTGLVAGVLAYMQAKHLKSLPESYQDTWLPWMLLIIAIAIPIQSPAAVLQARLRLDLQFSQLSRITMWSALLRNVSLVAGAFWLRNPLAFFLPMIIIGFYEAFATYRVTRESPWRLPAKLHMWWELLSIGGWMMLQSAANILFDLASFGVIGLFVPNAVVGNYVFAYTWITQTQTLLGYALMQVLFSALARLKDDVDRFRWAIRRAQRVQMLLGTVASLGLAVIMRPLESMIWGGKWADCVSIVMILGVFFPFRVTFGLSNAAMLARGKFKALSLITLAEGIFIVAAAGTGAAVDWTIAGIHFGGDANSVAWAVGISLLISRLIGTWFSLREIDISMMDIIKGMFPAWIVSLVAACIALSLTDGANFWGQYFPSGYPNINAVVHEVVSNAHLNSRIADFFMVCLIGGTFSVLMAIFSRFLLRPSVEDVLGVLPVRFASLGRRVMFMPASGT